MTNRFTVLTADGEFSCDAETANEELSRIYDFIQVDLDNFAGWLYKSARKAGCGARASVIYARAVLRGGSQRVIDVR